MDLGGSKDDNGCFMLLFYLFGVAIDDDGLLIVFTGFSRECYLSQLD